MGQGKTGSMCFRKPGRVERGRVPLAGRGQTKVGEKTKAVGGKRIIYIKEKVAGGQKMTKRWGEGEEDGWESKRTSAEWKRKKRIDGREKRGITLTPGFPLW